MKKGKLNQKRWAMQAAAMLMMAVFCIQPCMAAATGPGIAAGQTHWEWRQKEGFWYFYQAGPGAEAKYLASCWQWIDGYCYYFYEDGKMAAAGETPDGYRVSERGAWMDQEKEVWLPGKGILTKIPESGSVTGSMAAGSRGGSGSGGGSGGSTSGSVESDGNIDDNDQEEEAADDSGQEVLARLHYWERVARQADTAITGIENPLDTSCIVTDKKSNDIRICNMISMMQDGEPYEFYMIGKGYQADTLIIGQTFSKSVIYSHTIVESFCIQGVPYTISRIGIQKIHQEIEEIPEESTPSNGDYYAYGDTLTRVIGGRSYRFRCIDEDYQDGEGNYEQTALFLCDTVIRSDADSQGTDRSPMRFGETHHYKQSEVRRWLRTATESWQTGTNPVRIGVNYAYGGSTEPGTFEQMDMESLTPYDISMQQMYDDIFLLSLEEAMQYAEELWRFHGSRDNNPEEVYSPWSKGYYLRTPLYQEENGIYAVNLLDGNIHAVDTSDRTMGLRPAFTIKNN